MMQKKQIVIALLVSLLAGLVAVLLATRWLATSGRVSLVRVVQAARPIAIGTTIANDDVKVGEVPSSEAPRDALSGVPAAIGRITQTSVQPGTIVVESMLQPPRSALDLAQAIAPGMRAFSIHVDEESQVSGFVLPGNYVDVVLSTKDDAGQPASVIVLQRLLVLAVAQDRLAPAEGKPKLVNSVTLQVSPEQAQALDLARSIGGLTLVLRNQTDQTLDRMQPTGRRGLLQASVALPTAAASAPRRAVVTHRAPAAERVEVIRGIAP